jgi:hypothetical protein
MSINFLKKSDKLFRSWLEIDKRFRHEGQNKRNIYWRYFIRYNARVVLRGGDGFLYRSPNMAMRYAMSNHPDVLVCGMNTLQHVYEAVEAVCQGPLTAAEQSSLLMDAPELGNYVCRQCGNCSAQLKELFRLEGYVDRQMIDYLEHDPADYALRLRLSSWFSMKEKGLSVFKKKKWDEMKLLKEAASVSCPYRIDVSRKVRLSLAKLSGGNPDLV